MCARPEEGESLGPPALFCDSLEARTRGDTELIVKPLHTLFGRKWEGEDISHMAGWLAAAVWLYCAFARRPCTLPARFAFTQKSISFACLSHHVHLHICLRHRPTDRVELSS